MNKTKKQAIFVQLLKNTGHKTLVHTKYSINLLFFFVSNLAYH